MFKMNWLKRHKYFIILALIGLIFLLVYCWLFINIEPKFTSPDETANFYFINLFIEEGQLRFHEPLNEIADGLVKPRSMGFVDGYTVPGSFFGMIILYGLIGKIFGSGIILFLTPLFSIIGVLFFYLLLKEVFSKQVAFVSALFLFVLPPFWHYSTRGMFHNILFISLLIIGVYCLVKVLNNKFGNTKQLLFFLISGLFIGLSLMVRTSETIWVGLALLILFIFNRSKINWKSIISFAVPIIIIFFIIFNINSQLYGSPLSFSAGGSSDSVSEQSISHNILYKASQLILPFGVDFDRIGDSLYKYVVLIFPWFSILFFIGLAWLLKNIFLNFLTNIFPNVGPYCKKLQPKLKIYFWIYIVTAIWLVLYYGSYEFYEYIDKSKIILGSSYLRYWLPLYIFGLPFCALALMEIKKIFKNRKSGYLVVIIIIFLFFLLSISKVLLDPLHGIYKIKMNNSISINKEQVFFNETGPDSVIIAGSADKVFFPKRKVMVSLPKDNKKFKELITKLVGQVEVYYFFNPLDSNSEEILNRFKQNNFLTRPVHEFLSDNEIIYQVIENKS